MSDLQNTPPNHHRLLKKAMAHASSHHDQGAQQPPDLQSLARQFPDYEIHELIGSGGMSTVFRATQCNLQRPVAIKILSAQLARDPEFGERFLREARTLATLNHPSILTVHDYGERDGMFFLVTEYVDGVNLRQLMELGELSAAEALRIAPEICVALQYAHERGVVHRDIKPENILVDTHGRVKIADFGLAKVARPDDQVALTRHTAVLGTPHYMAPEQWQGAHHVDHRADIYSLGVVLYEMLTGNLPLGHFDAPSERAGVPHGLDAVVRRALAQKPANRYQSASDVRQDVESQAQNLGEQTSSALPNPAARNTGAPSRSAPHPSAPSPAAAPASGDARLVKLPFAAAAVMLAIVVALGFLIYFTQQEHRLGYQFRRDLAAYHSQATQALELQAQGQSVAATSPLPRPPAVPWISADAAPIASLSLFAGGLLLIMLSGFASIRAIRNSQGRRCGMLFALVTAWLVPIGALGAIACSPLASIRSEGLQLLYGTAAVGACLYAAGRFLKWELGRQNALLAQNTCTRLAGLLALLSVLTLAAFINSYAAPRYLPVDPQSDHYTYKAGPTFAADLVGQTRDFVLKKLGPPEGLSVSDQSQSWAYRDGRGELVKRAVVFAGSHVVSVNATTPVLARSSVDATKPHLGQPIAVFVRAYGPAIDQVRGSRTTELEFANGMKVSVYDGRAVGIR